MNPLHIPPVGWQHITSELLTSRPTDSDNTDGTAPSLITHQLTISRSHAAALRGIWRKIRLAVVASERFRQCRDPGASCRCRWRGSVGSAPAAVHVRGNATGGGMGTRCVAFLGLCRSAFPSSGMGHQNSLMLRRHATYCTCRVGDDNGLVHEGKSFSVRKAVTVVSKETRKELLVSVRCVAHMCYTWRPMSCRQGM